MLRLHSAGTRAGRDAVWLDPATRERVEASAARVQAVAAGSEAVYGINTGFGKLASVRIGAADTAALQRNLILSHCAGVGEPLAAPVVRLIAALKLASLGRGASGVRWCVIEQLQHLLSCGVTPIIPAQGSVGASGDLAPLAHLTAVMIGEGEAFYDGTRMPGAQALAAAGLSPITLGPKEGLAMINGTQVSTALAITGLLRAWNLAVTALVTGALSTDAAMGSSAPFRHEIHELRGHSGQIDAAATLRLLMDGSGIRDSHMANDERVQDPYCLRCQPQVMGAVMDLLGQAGQVLEREANAVTDNPLVFTDTGEAISGGNFHAEPVAFAADQIAMAACEIGSISERRIALLTDPAVSGLPAFLTPNPGINSGFMIAHVTAAALVSENKQKAYPASVDSIPTSANQEDHVSMATHGAFRLLKMAENLHAVVGIEAISAVQGMDFHLGLQSSPRLEKARKTLREAVPAYGDDRYFASDIEAARDLVASGGLVAAAGEVPGIV